MQIFISTEQGGTVCSLGWQRYSLPPPQALVSLWNWHCTTLWAGRIWANKVFYMLKKQVISEGLGVKTWWYICFWRGQTGVGSLVTMRKRIFLSPILQIRPGWQEMVSISLSSYLLSVRRSVQRKKKVPFPLCLLNLPVCLWGCFLLNISTGSYFSANMASCAWQSVGASFQRVSVAQGARSCRARLPRSRSATSTPARCSGNGCAVVVDGSSARAAGKRVE